MSDDLRDHFIRDIERVELPPPEAWLPASQPRGPSPWRAFVVVPAFAGVIVLALIVAFVIQLVRGDLPSQVAKPPASASPTASATASTISSPAPSPVATAPSSPTPSSRALPASDAVHVSRTLPASGQWALILRRSLISQPDAQGQIVTTGVGRESIMAVPLAPATTVGQQIPLLDYVGSIASVGALGDNLLREQFSPDGHQLVLSVFDSDARDARLVLVIVDLVSGSVGALTNDPAYQDLQPAWSPSGDEIAFVRKARAQGAGSSDLGVWSIRPNGSGLRRILAGTPNFPESTGLFSWNGDGTAVGFSRGFEGAQYQIFDAATARVTTVGQYWAGERDLGDWRTGSPAFVGAFMEGPRGGRQFLVVADQSGANARVVSRGDATDGNTYFSQARWRPGSDEILFVRGTVDPAAGTSMAALLVTDPSGKTPRQVAEKRGSCNSTACGQTIAAWSSNGAEIIYVYGLDAGGELHLVGADGRNDRVIQAFGGVPEARVIWLDLAVLSL